MQSATVMEPRKQKVCDVVVVDDDRDFADSLAQLLRLEGYTVGTAYSSDQAMQCLHHNSAAVVLVDLRLGMESGVQLIRDICACYPETAAIMMTAYASVDSAVEALQAGAYDYLCKPFFTEDLLATLRRCFERRRLMIEREEAEAMLRARNRELNVLNARLSQILDSIQLLSRFERRHLVGNAYDDACRLSTTQLLCKRLLDAVVSLLEAQAGALYIRQGETMCLEATLPAMNTEAAEASPPLHVLEEAIAFRKPVAAVAQATAGKGALNGALLAFPLFDNRASVLGGLLVGKMPPRDFTQQDIELGQILVSFGAEAIQAAQVTEHLAQSEERLSNIINNTPSAICLKDLQGRFLLTNSRYDGWFWGAKPSDAATSAQAEGSVAWATIESEMLPDNGVIQSRKATSRELEVTLADGAKHRMLVTKFPVFGELREAVGIGTIATDVTEQRLAEERLRQSQRIKAIGQLTGGIAHDFNNLLAIILGNLRLLQEEIGDHPNLIELLGEALEATKAGAELTSRLLAFGRGQSLCPQTTDIRQLVLKMSRLLERSLGASVAIRLDLAPDVWSARIDRNQLKASLLNLAFNARDAMQGGGELLIRASNAVLEESQIKSHPDARPGLYVVLSVTDTGVGMTPEVLNSAIQPFFTTKETGHGSGLGLSMVYGFVSQSGGHMEITSETGKGTCVSLFLPASLMPPEVAIGRQELARSRQGERVLVVEDQPSVRRLTHRLLTRLGYKVVEASDGHSALKILEESSGIDLLFTDIVLPGEIDGFVLGRRAITINPNLRVIYTTGFAEEPMRREADRSAIILRKPVQAEELSRALRVALDQN